MKNYLGILSLIILYLSCDRVDYRTAKESINNGVINTQKRSKIALLEYFTGHTCGNCPSSGGGTLNDVENNFKEKTVILTIHSGFFARPRPNGTSFSYDFRTTQGTAIDTKFGVTITGTPKGMVNRANYNGTNILTPEQWIPSIQNSVNDSAKVAIEIQKTYLNRTLTSNVKITALENINENLKLELYIKEDSIVNWQRDYQKTPEDAPDYIHRHVLRTELTNNNGTMLSSTPLNTGQSVARDYTFTLPQEWADQKCYLVVLVSNEATNEILQAKELKIK